MACPRYENSRLLSKTIVFCLVALLWDFTRRAFWCQFQCVRRGRYEIDTPVSISHWDMFISHRQDSVAETRRKSMILSWVIFPAKLRKLFRLSAFRFPSTIYSPVHSDVSAKFQEYPWESNNKGIHVARVFMTMFLDAFSVFLSTNTNITSLFMTDLWLHCVQYGPSARTNDDLEILLSTRCISARR